MPGKHHDTPHQLLNGALAAGCSNGLQLEGAKILSGRQQSAVPQGKCKPCLLVYQLLGVAIL